MATIAGELLGQLGMAALSYIAKSATSEIMSAAYPPEVKEASFSAQELDQLQDTFKRCLDQEKYQSLLEDFKASKRDLANYVSDKNATELPNIETALSKQLASFKPYGSQAGQVYLAAASEYILVQRLKLDNAITNKSEAVDGAQKNVADAALNTLDELIDLEESFCKTAGWENFISLKRFMLLQEGLMPAAAVQAFGDKYLDQVQALMAIVGKFDSSRVSEIAHPAYILKCLSQSSVAPQTYECHGMNFYTCQLPPLDERNKQYYPLSDCATKSSLSKALYIAEWKGKLTSVDPSSFVQVWNDHGRGRTWNHNDYSGFVSADKGIGSWNSVNEGASSPDDASTRCTKLEDQFYTTIDLGQQGPDWTDKGSGAKGSLAIWMHPLFKDFGISVERNSYDTPRVNTTWSIDFKAFSGFQDYVPQN